MLNLNPLSQNDNRWRNLKLGNSSLSVGSWGCCLTAACMAASAFGKNITPDQIAENNSVFLEDGNLLWLPLCEALDIDFGYRIDTNLNNWPNHLLVKESAARLHMDFLASLGMPTMVLVDTNKDGTPNHWVTFIGESQCIDPWDGQMKNVGSFGGVYGLAIFNGTPVLAGGKVAALIGKANEIYRGRNVELNTKEIMDTINRP